jgi:nitrate reductase cytochrome c-type subunit
VRPRHRSRSHLSFAADSDVDRVTACPRMARLFVMFIGVGSFSCDRGVPSPESGAAALGVAAQPATAQVRASRRAYDGAPPTMPHSFGGDCIQCHGVEGKVIEGIGVAPAAPHDGIVRPGRWSRCEQCHVPTRTASLFRENGLVSLRQDLRRGQRQHPFAPPVIPHQVLARENCHACHTGVAARQEIRCDHPDRGRCTQCHLAVATRTPFARVRVE